MRKVSLELLREIFKEEERQQKEKDDCTVHYISASGLPATYYKGHNVPAGTYLVKLLEISCPSVYFYYLKVEVLLDNAETKIINGPAKRNEYGFYDLAKCFSNGVLHKSPDPYVGELGVISLDELGNIEFIDRTDTTYFSNIKKDTHDIYEDFDKFLNGRSMQEL